MPVVGCDGRSDIERVGRRESDTRKTTPKDVVPVGEAGEMRWVGEKGDV